MGQTDRIKETGGGGQGRECGPDTVVLPSVQEQWIPLLSEHSAPEDGTHVQVTGYRTGHIRNEELLVCIFLCSFRSLGGGYPCPSVRGGGQGQLSTLFPQYELVGKGLRLSVLAASTSNPRNHLIDPSLS